MICGEKHETEFGEEPNKMGLEIVCNKPKNHRPKLHEYRRVNNDGNELVMIRWDSE